MMRSVPNAVLLAWASLLFGGPTSEFAHARTRKRSDGSQKEEKHQRLDEDGDPLPPGALARYGTTRLGNQGVAGLTFSPDGK